jgi:hypothetical protein
MIVSKCLPWMWNFLSELLRIDGYNWIFNTWRYHKLNLSKIKEYITLVLPALPEAYTGLGNTFCVCPSFRNIFKVTVSTILSDFLNRNYSPNLEQMWVKIHLKQPKTPKSGFHEIFQEKRVRKQFVSGLL